MRDERGVFLLVTCASSLNTLFLPQVFLYQGLDVRARVWGGEVQI